MALKLISTLVVPVPFFRVNTTLQVKLEGLCRCQKRLFERLGNRHVLLWRFGVNANASKMFGEGSLVDSVFRKGKTNF